MDGEISIEINDSPVDLLTPYKTLFTKAALDFLAELIITFDADINQLYCNRSITKYQLKQSNELPKFMQSAARNNKLWKVRPVPKRLENRHLDLGDVSPANIQHLINSLNADVQGIQVDFDDGHCPTWRNQIIGLYNVYMVVHGNIVGLQNIEHLPVLMLRPRAWNMIEHNIMVNGKKIPGPLMDFAILMFHNAHILTEKNCGPFFYLSKVEGAHEAKLWDKIFSWTEKKLQLPYSTIRACVLIENILSSFEMEEILYELKDHSLGLNCGIWDYAASIIAKFGDRVNFVLPDRNKYVNMQRHFLKKYMELVVQVCHSRGTYATGGMAAQLITDENSQATIDKVILAKKLEIETGVDGFMVYDVKLVKHMNELWYSQCGLENNQIEKQNPKITITDVDLLKMPTGGVTLHGLKHNIEVSILFIFNWLNGNGHFYNKGSVEDSATAEISRSQIWQWIRHKATIEGNGEKVTKTLVENLTKLYLEANKTQINIYDDLQISAKIFLEIITAREFPDFITTYLNDNHVFRKRHEDNIDNLKHKM